MLRCCPGNRITSREHTREFFGRVLKDRKREIEDLIGLCEDVEYENVVFEGGGAKGVAFLGAVKVRNILSFCQGGE
jgi:hypothetical protein